MTAEDDELATSLRDEELQVLQAIYPDYVLENTETSVRVEVPIELGPARRVVLKTDSYAAAFLSSDASFALTHLPPILLDIELTSGYPVTEAPTITSMHVTHNWLPAGSEAQLAQVLQQTWVAGEGALCDWVELIRSGNILAHMCLTDNTGTIRLPRTAAQPLLKQTLLAYDAQAQSAIFSQSSYSCSICFASLRGSRCVQLSCMHVFCRSCLQEYWGLCIAEGAVERVGCADPECVKNAREANEEEVRRVVSEKEVIRWKWLRVKKAVEKDPNVIHCPIPSCQEPVPKPASDPTQSSGWDRFRSCAACGFNFCSFCNRTWHGALSECPKSVTLGLVMEYLDLPEGSPERSALERKFGKGVVLRLVKQYQEEKSTNDWMENSTTACPTCNVHVEKSMGCNHMTCAKCKQHFCYKCGSSLSAVDPYAHFSAKGSACYGQLFDYHRDEDDWQPILAIEEL